MKKYTHGKWIKIISVSLSVALLLSLTLFAFADVYDQDIEVGQSATTAVLPIELDAVPIDTSFDSISISAEWLGNSGTSNVSFNSFAKNIPGSFALNSEPGDETSKTLIFESDAPVPLTDVKIGTLTLGYIGDADREVTVIVMLYDSTKDIELELDYTFMLKRIAETQSYTITQQALSRTGAGIVQFTPKVKASLVDTTSEYTLKATLDNAAQAFYTSDKFKFDAQGSLEKTLTFNTDSLPLGTHTVKLELFKGNESVKTETVTVTVSSSSGSSGSGGGGGGSSGGGSSATPAPTSRPSTETIPPDDTPTTTIVQPFMSGFSDGTLGPDKSLTRAQLAQLIYNLYGNNSTTTQSQVFSDVTASHWAFKPVMFCNEKGYMIGYEDKTFKPDQNITRAEFAASFARIRNIESTEATNFTDVAGHWALNYISGMTKEGNITGYNDNTFRPNNKISRAEAAAIICRVNDYDEAKYDSGKTFNDLSSGHWAYGYLMLATNGFNLTAEPSATPSPETSETPTPSASPSASAS